MKKGKLMISWLISYLIVLMLPVIVYSVTLVTSNKIVETEVCENNLMLVHQMRTLLDERLEDAMRVCDMLRADQNISSVFPMHFPLGARDHYKIYFASESFRKQISQNMFISSGYIYMHATNQSMCNGSLYDFPLLMQVEHSGDQIDAVAWKEILLSYHYHDFIIIPTANGENRIALLASLPVSSLEKSSATLVLLLNTGNYLDIVPQAEQDNGSTLNLITEDGTVIVSSGLTNSIPPEADMPDESGYFTRRTGNQRMLYIYAKSKHTGWKYVSIAKLTVSQRMAHLKLLMVASLIISTLGGLVIAYWMARQNFQNVQNLIDRLSRKGADIRGISGNEYQQIEQILDATLRHTNKLSQIVESQNAELQKHAMERLLTGSYNDSSLSFRFDNFAVMILFLNETTESTLAAEQRTVLLQSSMDVIAPSCSKYADIQSIIYRDMGIILLNMEEDSLDVGEQDDLIEIIKAEQTKLQKDYHFLGVSVSTVCNGMNRVHLAFQEALSWVHYALELPPAEHAVYGLDKTGMGTQRFVATRMQEDLLVDTINSGNDKAAISLVDKLCEPLYATPVDIPSVKCFFYDLLATLLRSQEGQEAQAIVQKALVELDAAADTASMQIIVKRTAKELANAHQIMQQSNGENALLDEVIKMIAENHTDPDFNITKLSDMLNRNTSYLSKYFKDKTGVGLYDYLNRIRIAHAKELIDGSNASISSLIGQAGFENLGSFIRVFKKYEGITPGAFQKATQKQETAHGAENCRIQ